uniref:VCBS repeat-containing protein n=1 Tax=Acetatifactor sp. TaxID=1872090 RepID=UPI00405607A7
MKRLIGIMTAVCVGILALLPVKAASTGSDVLARFEEYQKRFEAISHVDDISTNGYIIDETQIFPILLESFGEEEVTFLTAMDMTYNRLALFLADAEGNVIYKYNQFETNYMYKGVMKQPTESLASVSFQDVNHDNLTDIILITKCVNETGEYAGRSYKVGDVLFQGDGTFYRDWRISDKINRFSMNMSANCIISFVRDGCSTEFLYTATTLEELTENGFRVSEEQSYTREFEKLGRLKTVPGTFRISNYDVFMVYLVDEQGDIVWSFQPMKDYDNLYSLKGITGKDVDGDGMKDLVVLARYSRESDEGMLLVDSICSIYYQRTGGFDIDKGFEEYYRCTEEDTLEAMVAKIREYWGWKVEKEND